MDHNLDDSLNLESAIGVDFDHSQDNVVSQADISLGAEVHDGGIPMEFGHIEEQPMLMDTGNEEIIVSDFMGEQFTLQEYSTQDDQMASITPNNDAQEVLTSQSESMIDLQFEPQAISVSATSDVVTSDVHMQPKIIAVKASTPTLRPIAAKKEAVVFSSAVPRQIAIAPKPPRLDMAKKQSLIQGNKQYAIAPKPMSLVGNKSISLVKKVTPAGVQATSKGNTVLAQIGKQLVMVPATGQKIKLVTAGPGVPTVRLLGAADAEQAQLITSTQGGKTVKVLLQGQQSEGATGQTPIITKVAGGTAATRLVAMQQKTVPISIGNNKMLLTSPTKSGMKITKKHQVITIKSPTPKLLPASTTPGPATKKLVITTNPQNVILKTTQSGTLAQVSQIPKNAKSQLHQISVPGKGVQYIRLVTNPTSTAKTTAIKTSTATTSKTFVLTDSKGNLIQMSADKMGSQPPPLVVTSSAIQKITSKPQQKLVRIAPVSKPTHATMQHSRGQSLLAPLSPAVADPVTLQDVSEILEQRGITPESASPRDLPSLDDTEPEHHEDIHTEDHHEPEKHYEPDSKAALRALIADAVGEDANEQSSSPTRESHDDSHMHDNSRIHNSGLMHDNLHDVHEAVEYDRVQTEDSSSAEQDHPLIVVPSFMKRDHSLPSDHAAYITDDARRMNNNVLNVEVESFNPYQSPDTPPALSESDLVSTDLGLRPRKACNCTKSQCLKLYCDCFANGEFCNGCNCTNCHNNLENEELRQKAIRGCLDRNPNAFRPKIGKSKSGGPEIVRRHNKGCNCKRSGCLKNYCECYEAKIACTSICKCVGCRNVEETLERARRHVQSARNDAGRRAQPPHTHDAAPGPPTSLKQPCSFMTSEVIEAVCQCLLAAAVDTGDSDATAEARELDGADRDPVRDVIEEFARCLQDIISASHQAQPLSLLDETHA
ncbi:protein lin-54 homolog isoform X2 [Hyposmocoma kahamanoa]|uniref:protein lin-54 homolog isoform X2 n=1 Tax=Hyposmocoma kahamanoa TaxID=1477025 RepID=UPI000E6D808B|nr:protein lin-54 homolog isoform X2 [Hyposmocoma kahamanoa]